MCLILFKHLAIIGSMISNTSNCFRFCNGFVFAISRKRLLFLAVSCEYLLPYDNKTKLHCDEMSSNRITEIKMPLNDIHHSFISLWQGKCIECCTRQMHVSSSRLQHAIGLASTILESIHITSSFRTHKTYQTGRSALNIIRYQ